MHDGAGNVQLQVTGGLVDGGKVVGQRLAVAGGVDIAGGHVVLGYAGARTRPAA